MNDSAEDAAAESVEVDWRALTPDALRNVLEDLVTRSEPDEMSLDLRCRQLRTALEQKKVHLHFDLHEETIFLKTR